MSSSVLELQLPQTTLLIKIFFEPPQYLTGYIQFTLILQIFKNQTDFYQCKQSDIGCIPHRLSETGDIGIVSHRLPIQVNVSQWVVVESTCIHLLLSWSRLGWGSIKQVSVQIGVWVGAVMRVGVIRVLWVGGSRRSVVVPLWAEHIVVLGSAMGFWDLGGGSFLWCSRSLSNASRSLLHRMGFFWSLQSKKLRFISFQLIHKRTVGLSPRPSCPEKGQCLINPPSIFPHQICRHNRRRTRYSSMTVHQRIPLSLQVLINKLIAFVEVLGDVVIIHIFRHDNLVFVDVLVRNKTHVGL